MCPVCLAAVGVGLGLSRWLHIDDTISGLWMGALIISLSLVLANQTKIRIPLPRWLVAAILIITSLASVLWPLAHLGIIGHPLNTFYGIDKLVFGITSGMAIFSLSILLHVLLKKNHGNKSYFPFQKVVIPLLVLLVSSVLLYIKLKIS